VTDLDLVTRLERHVEYFRKQEYEFTTLSVEDVTDLLARLSRMQAAGSAAVGALRPFAAFPPSSLYPPDGSDPSECYEVFICDPTDRPNFTGADVARARTALTLASEVFGGR
jgi:hypothetical protein